MKLLTIAQFAWVLAAILPAASPAASTGSRSATPAVSASTPVRMTSNGDNLKPYIAIRPKGGVYLSWARKIGERTSVLFARVGDGSHASSSVQVSAVGMHLDLGAESGPNIAVDPNGVVYVVWAAGSTTAPANPATTRPSVGALTNTVANPAKARAGGNLHGSGHPARPGNLNIWLAKSEDDGTTFSTPIRVNDDKEGPEHRFPTVAADSHGGVCVAWLDKRTTTSDGQDVARVFYARSTDGGRTFGSNRDATAGQSNPICHCCRVGIACDANLGLLIAFRNDIRDVRDMFLIRSTDDGGTFAAPTPLEHTGWTLPNCPMDGPSIGVDRSGNVHAVWMSGGEVADARASTKLEPGEAKILFTTVGANGAHTPQVLGSGHHPRLAVGSTGDTFIVWHDNAIRLARMAGSDHKPAWVIQLAGEKSAPSYPSIAAASTGSLYCAWQQLLPDDSVQIYLSHIQGNGQ